MAPDWRAEGSGAMTGDPQLSSNPVFSLDAHSLVVTDPQGQPSPYIIDKDHEFRLSITLEFDEKGLLVPWILCCLCWRVCYCFDVICLEEDHAEARGTSRCSDEYCGRPDRFVYDGDATGVIVPAGTLRPGTYRITAVVRFRWRCPCEYPLPRPPINAFTDGTIIQITD
jgi:hypothetical protein